MARSLSARRAWIEIEYAEKPKQNDCVALRKESVDRNAVHELQAPYPKTVALRKESVDRNSASRIGKKIKNVALRKESVDRNGKLRNPSRPGKSRSPQGERG